MKIKRLFILFATTVLLSCTTAYCSTNESVDAYEVEVSTIHGDSLAVSTHMYFDIVHGNEIHIGNRILFPVSIIENSLIDSSYFYAPRQNKNEADLLKLELEKNVYVLTSCKEKNDYELILEALNSQLYKILKDNPNMKYNDILK